MSGGNGIIKLAKVNREEELAPLKFRGISFRTLDPLQLTLDPSSTVLLLTGDQALQNLELTGGAGASITVFYPTAARIIRNYFYTIGLERQMSVTNFSSRVVNLVSIDNPPNVIYSPVFNPVVQPNETRIIRIRVLSPTQIYFY